MSETATTIDSLTNIKLETLKDINLCQEKIFHCINYNRLLEFQLIVETSQYCHLVNK